MRRAVGAAVWASLALAAAGPTFAAPPLLDPPIVYVVRAGDTIYDLAGRSFIEPTAFEEVVRLNRIADPRKLPIGFHLVIPRAMLKSTPIEAKVEAFRGEVTLTRQTGSTPVTLGMLLAEGDRLRTGPQSFVTLGLSDGSKLSLPSRSQAGIARLRRIEMTGQLDRVLDLNAGRGDAAVRPGQPPDGRFEIRTPISVAAVRGTRFRVGYDPVGDKATTEVEESTVEVASAASAAVAVHAGLGVMIDRTGAGAPRALLPPPSLEQPARVQTQKTLVFEITPDGAVGGHRVQLANDAGFLDLFAETDVRGPTAQFKAPADGDYFVRVTGLDAGGLEGLPRTYPFRRLLNDIQASVQRLAGDRPAYLFRWEAAGQGAHLYRFVLVRGGGVGAPIIDVPALTGDRITLSGLPAGEYEWKVESRMIAGGRIQSNWSPTQRLTIAARN